MRVWMTSASGVVVVTSQRLKLPCLSAVFAWSGTAGLDFVLFCMNWHA